MPLFSAPPPPPSSSLVLSSSGPLSKEQKAFNTLIRKIEARRATLGEWSEAIQLFKQQYVSDLLPLQDEATDLQSELARSLDRACGLKGVTKAERNKLSVMIATLTELILQRRQEDDIKALYNHHSQSDFDAEEAANLDDMKSMLEGMFGVDLGDDVDMNSLDDVMARMASQLETPPGAAAPARKKTARQQARDEQREVEEKQMSQSIREVYRKLASALHPDREPDPAERQRKTELMQRANDAYEKGNLLQLLELQLQLEHIDQAHLATLAPARLKHYTRIMKGQLAELEMEIDFVKHRFAAEFGLPPYATPQPKSLLPLLQSDVATCRRVIREVQEDLAHCADVKTLKAWLKTVKLQRRPPPDFDSPF